MKKTWIAILLTLIFPGLGHFYFGVKRKGTFLITSYFISIFATFIVIGMVLIPIVIIYSLYDLIKNSSEYVKG